LRRLIINADDFGYTQGVNRAIAECATAGVVTSATLIATGAAFQDALAKASQARVAVGCHIVLVDGKPVSPSSQIPSLRESETLRRTIGSLMKASLTGAIEPEDVHREATAQFKALRSAGIEISHADTHKHAHMFPAIYRPLLHAAKESGIPAIRNPFEPWSLGWTPFPSLWVRGLQTTLLRAFRSGFLKAVREFGMKTTDGTVGIAATGILNSTWLRRIVQGLPEGTWELVCHPGYVDEDLRAAGTRLQESRETERQALLSEEFRRILREERIELISYAEL
jgi:predicted glycoside hydrolase/deacetylase ChbG (UPF0249 family)